MPAKKKKTVTSRPTKVMQMKGSVYAFDADVLDEVDREVTEAVVTSQRISLDWNEDGEPYHVLAKSRDGGSTYRGHYGTPQEDPDSDMQIQRYTAKNGTELLIAKWVQHRTGASGLDIIKLSRAN